MLHFRRMLILVAVAFVATVGFKSTGFVSGQSDPQSLSSGSKDADLANSNKDNHPSFASEESMLANMKDLTTPVALVLSIGASSECKAVSERLEMLKTLAEISRFSDQLAGVEEIAVAVLEDKTYDKRHSLKGCPNLVMYRDSVPIVYDRENLHIRFDKEEVADWIRMNRQPAVRHLAEDTFEHLTQASTGATTGDWLVWFHDSDHTDLTAVWEAVASRLQYTKVVGEVDTTLNPKLAKRFEVAQPQEFMLFRQGKVYRYTAEAFNVHAFANFAEISFKNFNSKLVTPPLSPFDEKMEEFAQYIKESEYGVYGLVGVTCLLFAAILYLVCRESAELADSQKKDN